MTFPLNFTTKSGVQAEVTKQGYGQYHFSLTLPDGTKDEFIWDEKGNEKPTEGHDISKWQYRDQALIDFCHILGTSGHGA